MLLDALGAAIDRRTALAIVVTEGHLYIQIGAKSITGTIAEHRLD